MSESQVLCGDECKKKIGELIKDVRICMLTTAASDGTFDSRPLATQETDFDGTVYFLTRHESGKVIEIDTRTWIDQVLANYISYGFAVSNTAQACNPSGTPYDTSLMCSPLTYIVPNADQTYMFADDLHLSTRMHTLLAQYVEQQLEANGLGH